MINPENERWWTSVSTSPCMEVVDWTWFHTKRIIGDRKVQFLDRALGMDDGYGNLFGTNLYKAGVLACQPCNFYLLEVSAVAFPVERSSFTPAQFDAASRSFINSSFLRFDIFDKNYVNIPLAPHTSVVEDRLTLAKCMRKEMLKADRELPGLGLDLMKALDLCTPRPFNCSIPVCREVACTASVESLVVPTKSFNLMLCLTGKLARPKQ